MLLRAPNAPVTPCPAPPHTSAALQNSRHAVHTRACAFGLTACKRPAGGLTCQSHNSWTRLPGQPRHCQSRLPCKPCQRTRLKVSALRVENRELVVGDSLVLVAFCLYKQIAAIALHPHFPGWLAPLHFNFVRFEEFAAFVLTVCCSWFVASLLVGNYTFKSTADIPVVLNQTAKAWLVSMPVAACQLVLTTAAESHALIGETSFADRLPLAASGPAEPLATAASILGLMALWRAYYTTSLDMWNFRTMHGSRINRSQDMAHFGAALRGAALVTLAACIALQIADYVVDQTGIIASLQQLLGSPDLL